MKICVIGGGIGGLAFARAAALNGADVTVLEQADAIKEVGAGLQISPNGIRVIEALGLKDEFTKNSVKGQGVSLRNYADAREVAYLDLTTLSDDQEYHFVHRADLVEVLAKGARDAGVTIRLLQKVSEISDAGSPHVVTQSGDTFHADVIVGADGVHSVARKKILGQTSPFFTHQVCWRATIPNDLHFPAQVRLYMGPKRHLVCYPLRGGELLNIVAVQERHAWADEGWHHEDDPKNLEAAFADFGNEVHALLERVEQVSLWGLFRHEVAPRWHNDYTALLGDAAHPTLPFLAQGANMALEDGWVLAKSLGENSNVAEALSQYQSKRIDRVRKVIDTASGNAWKYHLSFPPLRWLAHTGLRIVSQVSPSKLVRQFDWIYGHDVIKPD
ncbi:MAG: FAD-dependent monooxygenase [Paracoccaceae bacterium]|nr:FAD-dependent monooxygenase [Paracoccaceae bacterium]MDG1739500.1 FAD-dependent monooxygenase [Paracoccaceae bacterium]MDG2259209.1 FAD-dependent monooxygenase [Paracoccaceae bacterium]